MEEWELMNLLKPENGSRMALIVLNQPLKPDLGLFHMLWKKAVFKACADGGTNELYDTTVEDRDNYLPDLISGDFDSVRDEVLKFYKEKDVEIVPTPHQDFTDFTKCLKIVMERKEQIKIECVFVIGAFGGRLDQQFSNINTLYTAYQCDKSVPVHLMSSQSIACLLQKGSHRLHVDSGMEGENCGLVPLSGKCECITTTGLKWNLDHQPMEFGELISTSNSWNGEKTVTVDTDRALLWTMCIKLPK